MRPRTRTTPAPGLALAAALCLAAGGARAQEEAGAPPPLAAPTEADLYADLGDPPALAVTTEVPLARRLFAQGLTLAYGFHHDEAVRLFRLAQRADPSCAMAYWGEAYALGPHINNPVMEPERSAAAWAALARAREARAAKRPSERERVLLEALEKRYAEKPPEDRAALDRAYAEALRDVRKHFRKDPDVLALAAEALLDLHPWDYWTPEGKAKEDTAEVASLLEGALALDPRHPMAAHLYVHLMESSPTPAKALAAADMLRDRVPGSGHLVHMPGHIYIRTGDFAAASEVNRRAIAVDAKVAARVPRAGFYRVYMAHNHQFLSFACMMEGRSAEALRAARDMVAAVPQEFLEGNAAFIDGFLPIAWHVLVRFGRWEEILAEPAPDPRLLVCVATRHYARGAALAALGKLDEAEAEARALEACAESLDDRPAGNSPGRLVLSIARRVLAGEIGFRRGRADEAIASLRLAAKLEADLRYDEPPDWMMPVRHVLGATLLAAGKPAEAEAAYREDLARFPANGWSLTGLARALEAQERPEEAKAARAEAAKAFANADVKIGTSCMCQP